LVFPAFYALPEENGRLMNRRRESRCGNDCVIFANLSL
jgi:hypothetical protein